MLMHCTDVIPGLFYPSCFVNMSSLFTIDNVVSTYIRVLRRKDIALSVQRHDIFEKVFVADRGHCDKEQEGGLDEGAFGDGLAQED